MERKTVRWSPSYDVYEDGRVWSRHTGRLLKPFLSTQSDEYLSVKLCEDCEERTISVHRLVAEHFVPNPDNLGTVNHKDGNKQNNHRSNLEWMTQGDNKRHAFQTGVSVAWWQGDTHSRSTFTNEEVHEICSLFQSGVKPLDLAKSTTLLYQKLFRIWNRDNWKSISKDYSW